MRKWKTKKVNEESFLHRCNMLQLLICCLHILMRCGAFLHYCYICWWKLHIMHACMQAWIHGIYKVFLVFVTQYFKMNFYFRCFKYFFGFKMWENLVFRQINIKIFGNLFKINLKLILKTFQTIPNFQQFALK